MWPGIVNRRSITIGTCATRAGFRARTAMHHLITRGLAATPGSPETIECGCGLLYRPLRRQGTERHRPWPGPPEEVVSVCVNLLPGRRRWPTGIPWLC